MSQLSAALDYLHRRWSVIPVRERDKRPLVKWLTFQQRLATEAEVQEWYRHWPQANVGIVTGAISGLVVLDVDPRHGGEQSLAAWQRRYGPLPRTIQAITGGGGRHFYFNHPGVVCHNRAGVAPGIDLRGDGGCVVAPPSIHSSGKPYCWYAGQAPGETPLAPLPSWLLELLLDTHRTGGHTLDEWRQLAREGVSEGTRNSTLASLAGHLLWHGVDVQVVMELLLGWNRGRCKPPLGDNEVIRTVLSIGRLHRQTE